MGEQKNICTFEQRNCAELNHVDEIPWAKDRPGLLWYKNNIKSNLEIQRTKRVKWIRLRRIGIECEPIRVDDYTGKKMTFFHDPDGLPLELHE